jgi:hypothetical protein
MYTPQRILITPQRISSKPIYKPSKLVIRPLPVSTIKDVGVGKQLHILACGPSLLEVDIAKLEGDLLCVNKPLLQYKPKYWLFMDDSQKIRNQAAFNSYEGILINSWNVKGRRSNQIMLEQVKKEGFCTDGRVWIGKSSTFAACQVASYMGYEKVFIHGMDMGKVNGELHHYGKNEDVTEEYRVPRFNEEEKAWLWAAENLPKEIRQKFVFTSPYNKRKFLETWRA